MRTPRFKFNFIAFIQVIAALILITVNLDQISPIQLVLIGIVGLIIFLISSLEINRKDQSPSKDSNSS